MLTRTAVQILLRSIPREVKRRLGVHLGCCDARWSLQQVKRFGFRPTEVLDVGAFLGEWAKACLDIFPESRITCVEPQEESQKKLRKLAKQHPKLKVIQTLLGSRVAEQVPFLEVGSGSSVLTPPPSSFSTKPMTTIDQLILEKRIDPPEMAKLDVQGYEMEVLKGWTKGFEQCQVIQCEISLLPLVNGSPLLSELIEYFQAREFLIFDVIELIRSPSEGATWQIDALFCRKDSPLRTERAWRASCAPQTRPPRWAEGLRGMGKGAGRR